jgi:hypothetical protein
VGVACAGRFGGEAVCPGCGTWAICEVGRVTWEAGAALHGSTHCVRCIQ